MPINTISPIKATFKRLFPKKKDDIKIFNRDEIRGIKPDYTYETKTPIRIWCPKSVKLKEGQVLDCEKNAVFNRNVTCFVRSDLEWKDLVEYFRGRFNSSDKVNSYVWGCSDGSEAYSLNMTLLKAFKEQSKKFYPIIAKDIDPEILETAEKERKEGIEINGWVYSTIKSALGLRYKDVSQLFDEAKTENYVKLSDKVTNPIEFSYGNIVSDIETMDSKNPSIVFCRNMWPYVKPERYKDCAQRLYNTLAKGSVVVIGNYDYSGDKRYYKSDKFPNELLKAGFEPVSRNGLYKEHICIFEKN